MKNASMKAYRFNILSGLAMAMSKYGIVQDEMDYLDTTMLVLPELGLETFPLKTVVMVPEDGIVAIPCGASLIEGVCAGTIHEDLYPNRVTVEFPEEFSYMDNVQMVYDSLGWPGVKPTSVPGYVDYLLEDDEHIRIVDKEYIGKYICIAYVGYSLDPEGFPYINRKQVAALAAISSRNKLMKDLALGKQVSPDLFQLVNTQATKATQSANVPEEITDNELDDILDAHVSFGRKTYGRPMRYGKGRSKK